ncbi:MAG TPA: hypothetical protein VGL63_16795 [Streptosporangiaceae bacterium]
MPGVAKAIRDASLRRNAARLAVTGVLVASGVLVAAQAASASWLFQGTPTVAGAQVWSLAAVSCTSATSCMAVGSSDNSTSGYLSEQRSGATWTVRSMPSPGGGALTAISCTSASACTAVGDYFNGADTLTLAMRWNGTSWVVQATPNPAGATTSSLNGISCTSATACTAVGSTYNGTTTTTLAEAWNGSSWTIQTTANASGEATNQLNDVSCQSASACTAVGYSANAGSAVTLAETWNGSSWTIQATPNPGGSSFNELEGVSCTSASACTAVSNGFAARWNGTAWSVQTIARARDELNRVSCVSATACTAVGSFFKDGVQFMTGETWNGTAWKEASLPITTSFDTDYLSDVSCQSATACTAVGAYHDPTNGYRSLVEVMQLNWQPQTAPVPTGAIATGFESVSCATAKACIAVGNYEGSGSTFDTFTESWNGSGWTILSTPNAGNSNLSGVSCSSATACTAVGDVSSGGSLLTLALRWNGTSWAVQSTPNPSGGSRDFLTSVSCTSATACEATGFYTNSSGNQVSLAESWNGSSWTIQSTPNPSGTTTTQFNSVSCTSASACTAVGYYLAPGFTMLAEVWNGTSWTIHNPSLPAGGSDGLLNGVSCTSASACTAVGNYSDGTRQVTLAERWNGSSWAVQATPNRVDAEDSFLASVSCTSATSCMATGSVRHGGPVTMITLALHWNGTSWHLSAPGAPFGAVQSNLVSVSCLTGSNCMGVGYYIDGSQTELPLAAPYN